MQLFSRVSRAAAIFLAGGVIAAVAINVGAPRTAVAQTTTTKTLYMTGAAVPITQASVGRILSNRLTLSPGYKFIASGSNTAGSWTCEIKFTTMAEAFQFAELFEGATALDCTGALSASSTASAKLREEDYTKDEIIVRLR